jgi:hypothetical protein
MPVSKGEELKKRLLKLKHNYELICKRYPEDKWYPDLLEGIELAIIEFNTVFTGGEICQIKPIATNANTEET